MAGFQNQGGQGGGGTGLTAGRLSVFGHSWVSPPPSVYPTSDIQSTDILGNVTQPNGPQWCAILRDALSIGPQASYYRTYTVPGGTTASTLTVALDTMPEDGLVEACWYIPGTGGILGGSLRNVQVLVGPGSILYNLLFVGAATQYVPVRVWSINDLLPYGATLTQLASPYAPAMRSIVSSTTMTPQIVTWTSAPVSTGTSDSGGQIVMRYGLRYRNYGVGGSFLLCPPTNNQQNSGGWNTLFSYGPWSRPAAAEVNLSGPLNSATLNCTPTAYPIKNGSVIVFPNGSTYTVGGASIAPDATTITGGIFTGTGGTVAAGQQGHVATTNGSAGGGAYDPLSPVGLHAWLHGLNDANAAIQDSNAWAETVRACIARCLCPAIDYLVEGPAGTTVQGNFTITSGSGAWGSYTPQNGSALPWLFRRAMNTNTACNPAFWTGPAGGGSGVVVSVGPAFEGGSIDVFFLGAAGTSLGVAATLGVDGTNVATINTSAVSTSGQLTQTIAGTVQGTGTATPTCTGTNFTAQHVGMLFTSSTAGVPAGTVITAVTSATSITLSNTATFAVGTATVHGWVPMVKRLTGLSSGAHSVSVTFTSVDSSANSVIVVLGVGLESLNPTTPLVWCNIARTPAQTPTQKNNSATLNTTSAQVIAGAATPLAGNSAEPGLGSNVVFVDIDSALNQSAALFLADGLHPNTRGHRVIAETILPVLSRFTTDQLLSR